ncbi:HTH-type transcriptional regulator MalT [Marinomonas spartinae]|uniref:HTH-type transcriptional regulator MalT n=1 Tax=Marinomonas spartinae TaxID=1792290 RepID=A0A1A8TSP4_9GAMM|nr:helix-turn-helix transcriptional regulator [Marinomonas spartinae]SBS37783.1 HTH-type transcriptional regulator MalT [Marinomonas spartinae]
MSRTIHPTAIAMIARLSEGLIQLVPQISSEDFPHLLVEVVKLFVPADEITLILFEDKPEVLVSEKTEQIGNQSIDMYLAGAYLLDPFYRASVELTQSQFFTYDELVPDGFRQSEFYKQYLVKIGLEDECGYLIIFPGGQFLHLSIGHGRGSSSRLTPSEQQLLDTLTPLIDMLCQQHWGEQLSKPLNRQLDQALANFGSSKLTERECAVIRMVLQGYSPAAIADKLFISPGTVRVHLRNSYKKLDIGSQLDLHNLFIGALMQFEHYEGGDPLEGFF